LERRASRYFWDDPRALLDPKVSAVQFRRLMSAVHVGDTIKITDDDRHPKADELLITHVDLTDCHIVDIGCSDGSTSVDLIEKLPAFASYTLADLYLYLDAVAVGRFVVFFDTDGVCSLVAGRRAVAWPSQSRAIAMLYQPIVDRASRRRDHAQRVLLLNPRARAMMESDPRVTYTTHDVFTPWSGQPPDVIKVANLLRRLYFSDERICDGVRAVLASLADGGHFLVVDNGRDGLPARAGLYQRDGDAFSYRGNAGLDPEIHDLVARVRLQGGATKARVDGVI